MFFSHIYLGTLPTRREREKEKKKKEKTPGNHHVTFLARLPDFFTHIDTRTRIQLAQPYATSYNLPSSSLPSAQETSTIWSQYRCRLIQSPVFFLFIKKVSSNHSDHKRTAATPHPHI